MVRVTVGMEAIWQEQDLAIDEEQGKAELESALEDAKQTGEDIDEEKLAAQVYEAVKVRSFHKREREICFAWLRLPHGELTLPGHRCMYQ